MIMLKNHRVNILRHQNYNCYGADGDGRQHQDEKSFTLLCANIALDIVNTH